MMIITQKPRRLKSKLYKVCKRGPFIFALIVSLLFLTSCSEKTSDHTHKWDAATCTRGEFCFSCGETQGEALGHDWVDATCTKAKQCSRCGKSEGNVLEHVAQNGTCSVCGITLNTVANLDERSGLSATYTDIYLCTVYGGVSFEYELREDDNTVHGCPVEAKAYNEGGALVATAKWQENPPMAFGTDAAGRYIYNKKIYTDFIPLAQGKYTVEYFYYQLYALDTDPFNTEHSLIIPAGNLIKGRCELMVKFGG